VTRRDVARVLFKHRNLILLTFLTVTALVVAGLMMLPATYATRAKILIRADQQADPAFFSGLAAVNEARAYETSGRRLETEMALLEVIPVSAEAVQNQKLAYDQVYHSPRSFFQTPVLEAVDRLREALFGTKPKDRRGFGATVRDFQGALSIQPAPTKGPDALSDIVVVTLRAPDPLVAQRSLSALLDAYLRLDAKINEDAGRAALRIVDAEAQEATAHLADAEQRLRDFLARHEGQRSATSAASAAPGADGAALARLKARLVELELDLLDARRVYRPESDQVRSLERQVGDLRARVRVDVAGDASDYSRETQLRRDVREAESRYDQLLARVEGISLFLQVSTQQVGQRVIIEPPGLPTSSDWQKRLVVAVAGAMFGLVLGLLFAGIREMSDQTMGTKRDVSKSLGMETAAVLPDLKEAELRAAIRAPVGREETSGRGRHLINAFRDLAASIRNTFPGGWAHESDGRVVLVTSARAREGASTVATGLAVQLAAGGAGQVLLVDDRTGLEGRRETLPGVEVTRPWCLPARSGESERAADAGPLRGDGVGGDASRAADFLREARRRYRWVIVDAGSGADGVVSTLAPLVDGALVVVEAEQTRKQVVRDSLRRLRGFTGKFVAVVLNRQRRFIPDLLYEYL
jgi:uncharacterized protein involved in exopolysaccharide biosynthesis/Mrp family chromosome partitioning ATPase